MSLIFMQILKGYFDMLAPDVELDDGKGTILISSEEGETLGEHWHDGISIIMATVMTATYLNGNCDHSVYLLYVENLPKRLSEFGVGDGSRLKCDDFQQNFQLVLQLVHRYMDMSTYKPRTSVSMERWSCMLFVVVS